jgi:excisionase family DNA binding protein
MNHSRGIKLLLKPREAAEALAVCERTLWELTRSGEIPALRIPGRGKARTIRYAIEDLRAWIERQKAQTRLPTAGAGV